MLKEYILKVPSVSRASKVKTVKPKPKVTRAPKSKRAVFKGAKNSAEEITKGVGKKVLITELYLKII